MQDLIITKERIKIEINKILICFLIANILNIYSIVIYETEWWEFFTQLHWVIILTLVMYFLLFIGQAIKNLIYNMMVS